MQKDDSKNPITHLFDELIYQFSNSNSLVNGSLFSLLKKGKINRHIHIDPTKTKLVTPTVDLNQGLISLHESHISYLWCVIYTLMALIDFASKRMSGKETFILMTDAPELVETNALMTWALSLKKVYSEWPKEIPSPEIQSQECEVANRICIRAILYMMYHELGHLSNGHDQYLSLVIKSELTAAESLILKQLEVEADNFAFECLTEGEDTEEQKFTNMLAASIAQISNLYLTFNTNDLIQLKHPDIDTRIFNLMNKVEFDNKDYRLGIDLIYNIGLSLFINQLPNPHLTEDLSFQSFEDILAYLYSCFDLEKTNLVPLKFKTPNN
jgi:hypothetical protein